MTVTAIPNAQTADGAADAPKEKGSKKKLIMIIVGVLAFGGGGYYMFLKPKPTGPPVAGEIVKLEPIQINLADSHYLRVSLALQLVKGAKEADGSKALDATISVFSGLPMSEVNNPKHREMLRKEL